MSDHYPRIRIYAENGHLLIRDGLSLSFYMRRPNQEVVPGVMRSLEAYVRAVGPQGLGVYAGEECWHDLDDAGWAQTRRDLLGEQFIILLQDASTHEERY